MLPLNAVQDAYSNTIRVNNCRMRKQITFFFLKLNFMAVLCATEIIIPIPGNSAVEPPIPETLVETKWLLKLRMYPIEKAK